MHLKKRVILGILLLMLVTIDYAFADYAKWNWNQQLPEQLTTHAVRSNRTPDAVDAFFYGPHHPPNIQQILDFLGPADAFSRQFMYSRTKGTAEPSKTGGTLRFLLDDGGEVHVWTPDFRGVGLAVRHRKKGNSELLYK
ncbi:hypothetical protein [Methylobacter sp.]|uniref:hypothetical protein n=1 Tax=Methylobacter sp. TaxID=2051955 RepID=UPI00122B91A0|nr:hypothetical protein [Methylobacter sp.]TAK64257.1 MAG: hypothetical protein EPO18_04890 [Methylobacter sp.]